MTFLNRPSTPKINEGQRVRVLQNNCVLPCQVAVCKPYTMHGCERTNVLRKHRLPQSHTRRHVPEHATNALASCSMHDHVRCFFGATSLKTCGQVSLCEL